MPGNDDDVNANFYDGMFDAAMYLMVGKGKHWENIAPGVYQVKDCYANNLSNKTKLTIKLEGEDYRG